ncbi:purine-cytosine permease family protein [Comamonas odontotermitis]|uniref:purine-cytosine permease family protein n=1 Tax=Comamonas odontotermitis TaxID=379895 RepID=UPI001CC43255|nr:cytosine permease [Comamonas odontotermitis]UBB18596.1 cytosine permease [Comamonas odontotermitis]
MSIDSSAAAGLGRMETRTIDMVPEHERHGSPSSQFTLWFGANMQITAVVDGALAVVFGAEAMTAILGLLIGNILGGIVMALHSAQGPRLGLPQMISSRVQFGVKGAALPLLLVILMYLGFAATGTVLSGQAINLMFGFSTPAAGIIIFGALTALVALIGYKLIHVVGRISTVVGILGFGYLAWQLCLHYDVASAFGQKPFTWTSFLTAMALSAGWQMTFAPYVADYSRYLPSKTSTASTFWTTFGGSVISAQLAMTFGVLVAALGGNFIKNQVGFLGDLAGPLAVVIYLVIVTGKLTVNCLNAYGGVMTMLTTVSAFNDKKHFSPATRLAYILGFVLLTVLVALLASSNFLATFKNFVLLLLTVFVPWSAVNLVDYYLVSKEKVDIPALYDSEGRYGAYNGVALFSYVLGIVVQIPFINQAMYEGPLAKAMGGADISWIVSLIVTSLVYYPLAKKTMKVPPQMIYPAGQPAAASEHGSPDGYPNTASAA